MFIKPQTYDGFLLPDGSIMVNYGQSANKETLLKVAHNLGAKLVRVEGELTFTPVAEVSVAEVINYEST